MTPDYLIGRSLSNDNTNVLVVDSLFTRRVWRCFSFSRSECFLFTGTPNTLTTSSSEGKVVAASKIIMSCEYESLSHVPLPMSHKLAHVRRHRLASHEVASVRVCISVFGSGCLLPGTQVPGAENMQIHKVTKTEVRDDVVGEDASGRETGGRDRQTFVRVQ